MRYANVTLLYFDTPLVFNSPECPDGWCPLGRYS